MRLTLTVVDPFAGSSTDVVLDADAESTVADVASELGERVGTPMAGRVAGHVTGSADARVVVPIGSGRRGVVDTPPPPLLYVDGVPLDPSAPLLSSPLREGAVVSLGDPVGCAPGEPTGLVELRVVGGPAAGAVHRLGVGRYAIGSGPGRQIRIEDDPELPEHALTLSVAIDGTCTMLLPKPEPKPKPEPDHDPAAARLDGEEIAEGADRDWPLNAQLTLGNTLFELARYSPPDAALKWSDDGAAFDYNRPPRLRPADRETTFRLPAPPREPDPRPLPWLMAVFPLVSAIVMCLVFNRWYYMIMAVFSPVILFANYFMDKKNGRKSHAKLLKEYEEHKARIEQDAQDALTAERADRRRAVPDPASVLTFGTGPRTRLWERRRTDADHLLLRVGTGLLPSDVVLDDPEKDEHRRKVTWEIPDAPVALPLRTLGVIGLAGPGDCATALGRWAVAQTATLHSPMDVQLYVLTEQAGQGSWDWLRWLPHSRPTGGQDAHSLLGTDAETVGARIGELTQILDARTKAAKERGNQPGPAFTDPDLVLVWDGSRRLRSMPGVVRLLREGPSVQMYSLCLDAEERFLPGECQAVVVAEPVGAAPGGAEPLAPAPPSTTSGFPSFSNWHTAQATAPDTPEAFRLRVEQANTARIPSVRPDFVTPAYCLRLARSLAPLRDISGETEDSALPAASRLLDVLQLEPPTGEAVAARWRTGGQSTLAVVGESYDGPFGIDIRRDGPHGLIAGTTGSGKSELLQTIVAALAVANTPESMTFVLVDYKGGSAFKDCVKLPHTVGMVTDLDAHLVERALESLGAELKRREHILAAADAKDIEDYQDLIRRNPGSLAPVPRLLIVIDEFASMVRDLPDFVTGLVNIAQRGRSLGIHLLLATQRPSGVVSPEIRANTNLRIALRVTDGSESSDVIDSPEAGNINKSTPGRAYVRLGAASLVPFQSGRVGGRRPGAADSRVAAPWSAVLDWSELGRSALTRPPAAAREEEEITDLKVLVDAVRDANERLAIPAQHSPWLPPLDEQLLLDSITGVPAQGALPAAPYGVEDIPAQQERRPVTVDFATFGHLHIAGSPRSGRSQVLRTIAASLARTHSVADVHLYGIDCGNGALNALTALPHCGAVVGRAQTERATRLISRLDAELTRRQDLLAERGIADIGEQRAAAADPAERLPHLVVLIDRWEGWLTSLGEIDHGELTDQLVVLMREGASVGIHIVITGDRQLASGRLASLTEDKLGLRLADRTDFSLIGIPTRKVPEEIPPGRAFRAETATAVQFALLSEDATGQGQAAAINAVGAETTAREAEVPRAQRPFRVDTLPSRITFPDAWALRDAEASRSPLWALVGVGGDELTGYGPDLATGVPAFVVAGPAKSGRSTTLLNMARSFLSQGVRLVVAAPRTSPLRELDCTEGVLKIFTDDDIESDELEEFTELASPEEPVVVIVDDAEMLEDCDAAPVFRRILQRGTDQGLALVLGGDEEDVCSGFSGWQVDVKKARRGLLLSPQDTTSGELIGIRTTRGMVGGPIAPGTGMLHLGTGEHRTVVTPV
ncbi:FtsK/SpoIIIE domain-containing protein [Streptomyces sp. NBC_00237]|uniref:FtsK/SpoIIIE domain-containing protein n=1 Tax=Streptomyces sp. NBC_00237 TaxID=2975687 RepID=UPI0022588157|nr:FtsK/SpoIIIE domain-containing protein [Streptomyces sp. NBC_00237]MCX5204960.1 FtsK/SpoIIIE domain-containing protein [Streptomyces sp. NBC_00237]